MILFYILDAEAHSAHLILAKAYNLHVIAECQNILNAINALLCDLGNVNHSFFARGKLDECAELLDTYNRSLKDLSLLEISRDDLDHLHCLIHHLLVCTADGYIAIIRDVDLHAGAPR